MDLEMIAFQISCLVEERIGSADNAYQFVMEELDAARQGNRRSRKFAESSGFEEVEYEGALERPDSSIDRPDGPQQILTSAIESLGQGTRIGIKVRVQVVERVILNWDLTSKYTIRLSNAKRMLKELISDDAAVLPVFTDKVSPPPSASNSHHVTATERRIEKAKKLLSFIEAITHYDSDKVIKSLMPDLFGDMTEGQVIAKLRRLSEKENKKSYTLEIQPLGEVYSWNFEIADEDAAEENELTSKLYDLRNGGLVAMRLNITKPDSKSDSDYEFTDDDDPFW